MSLCLACGGGDPQGDEVGETVGDSTTGDESTTDAESSSSDSGSTDDTTDATDTTTTTTTSETDTTGEESDACADTVLPPRNGAQIIVSPGDAGTVFVDGNQTTLRAVVSSASEGDSILLEDGVYTFKEAGDGEYTGIYITTPNITLRSLSGDPSAVTLDSAYQGLGGQSGVITIDAPGVVVADIGVHRSIFHLVHLWANGDDAILHNLELVDGGQQFLKSSAGDGVIDGVQVSCSRFVMTDVGRDNAWGYGGQNSSTRCYTGGIDTHASTNWIVRDNYFEGIYCEEDGEGPPHPAHGKFPELRDNMTYTGGLAEHAIHMWDSEAGTGHLLTRNRIVDCARGIGLGLVAEVHGTTISNNMVFSSFAASGSHDVGIIVERAIDTLVAHNSVYFSSPDAYPSGIEYRWGETSNLTLHGNLSNRMIRARDGAVAALADNLAENAPAAWFVDADAGDLHLAECSGPGDAALIPEVDVDFDNELRTSPTSIGADQCTN